MYYDTGSVQEDPVLRQSRRTSQCLAADETCFGHRPEVRQFGQARQNLGEPDGAVQSLRQQSRLFEVVDGAVAAIINSDARELEIWESNGSPQPFPIGKVCNAETNFKKLSDDEKNRTALQDAISKKSEAFLACAKRNIAKLDDRHSDASVVMRAVYRPCSEEFYQFYKAHKEINDRSEPEALKKQMEDRLLELVLLYRSSSKSK